jgi:hypothetical protein
MENPMSLRTVFNAERLWPVLWVVAGLVMIAGIVLVLFFAKAGETRAAKAHDVQLANGDPTWNTVNVYHDGKRGVTCYVETTHGGITCFLDITLEDQQRMLVYRDGGR